ncbi:MAG TPA: Crp/Fnr family transcriptional regulator [Chitinophagaceae bacterium]|jgi:CRP-like cAMP-binding protein|nr:Crp/Fnr family transcriptional regulator [Chitinophagaceae bacterium]HMU57065.1 Crp/Fnr family transcriptional regulator [Chitinophagaceae bacterium]
MIKSLLHIDEKSLKGIQQFFQPFLLMSFDEIKELLNYCEIRHFSKKEMIVEDGMTDDYLNIVISGLVRKFVRVKKGEETLQLATEGHVFTSELSFLERKPSGVFFQALEPATVISIQYNKMNEALEQFPQGEKLGRMILTRMYVKKGERIYIDAAHTARERFIEYVNRHPHMLARVPQKYLASYLQIKPETFSRMKLLVKQGKL